MNVWIVYDIESTPEGDKRRRKIVKEVKKKGLYRIQKSVFAGNISKNAFDELLVFSDMLIEKGKDSVYVFPLCDEDYKAVKIIGLGFNKDLVADKLGEFFV